MSAAKQLGADLLLLLAGCAFLAGMAVVVALSAGRLVAAGCRGHVRAVKALVDVMLGCLIGVPLWWYDIYWLKAMTL